MKKLFAILLVAALLIPMATVVSAANTTTLTTTVPAAAYTLNIPANQEIPFGATSTSIGNVTVSNSSGFAEGKNLAVTVTYTAFESENVTTTIPFLLYTYTKPTLNPLNSGNSLVFLGQSSGMVTESAQKATSEGAIAITDLRLQVNSDDWGKALAGDYSATITFTAEVVAG